MTQTITSRAEPPTLAWQSEKAAPASGFGNGSEQFVNGDQGHLDCMDEKRGIKENGYAVHGQEEHRVLNGDGAGEMSEMGHLQVEKDKSLGPAISTVQSPATPTKYAQPNADSAAPMTAVPITEEPKTMSTNVNPSHAPARAVPAPTTSSLTTSPAANPASKTTASPINASAGPSRQILSSYMASHPTHTVKRAMHAQFPKPNPVIRLARRFKVKHSVIKGMTEKEWTRYNAQGAELRRKAGWKMEEGEEGTPVGELFWKMYLSLMPTLERDPLSGLTSPDLLGSTSTIPLTIISLIPDIMRHYHDVIIRAKKEVFLATNYWQPSNSVQTITNSLKELSELVIKEKREKIIVKIMYDRGSVEQLWNSHAPVESDKWAAIDLPRKEDVPGLDLQVINFHRVLLGTFHAKFLIVDRKVALINSNNIQDRPNLELMSHLEGPIVDSFYEVALHSWYNALSPSLPCIGDTYTPPTNASGQVEYLFSDKNPYLADIEVVRAAREARSRLRQETLATDAEMSRAPEYGVDRLREAVRRVVDQQRQSLADWRPGERIDESVQNAMHELREIRDRWASNMGGAAGRSRPNSRGPSRRSSAHEGMLRTLMRGGGDKPGEYTIAHAPLHPAHGNTNGHDEESEAPSSPTMTEIPVKSHTMPTPGANPPGGDDRHVAFAPLEVSGLDTGASGHFMDGPSTPTASAPTKTGHHLPSRIIITESPMDKTRHAPFVAGGGFTASPVSGSIRLPDSPVRRTSAHASPILKPSAGPSAAGLTQSPLAVQAPTQANGVHSVNGHLTDSDTATTSSDPPVAFSAIPPAKGEKTLAEKVADRTVHEELTKESEEAVNVDMREGLPAGPDPSASGTANSPMVASLRQGAGDKSETATLDGLPIGAVGPGAVLGSMESEVPEGKGTKRLYKMSKMFNAAGVLSEAWATVEDSDELDNFSPHVIHKPHEPVPVAMCCRKPHGFPGHHDIRNPQNAAWLAGFRYAKKKVFVQSPTLNARPIVRAIKQACRRGVEVILLLDLGFNDKGESIPFQGGTNEEVVDRLYKVLRKEKKEQHLKVYWYTGKDQVRPLNAVKKQRNCHIKFAAYDDEVLIIGNGNQDSQSWFHSQEVNVMVDSKEIVAEMMETLLSNQNTIEYGLVDTDGIWRDSEGKTLKDYGATSDGKFRGLSGFIQFAKTI